MMIKSTVFDVRSFVPPEVYKAFGENSWMLLDPRIIETADSLANVLTKEWSVKMIINNWHLIGEGSSRRQSGLRTDTKIGAVYSQHRYGRAIDFVWDPFANVTPETVRNYISTHRDLFPHITRTEAGTATWVHVDCANVDTSAGIQWVNG